MDKPNFKPILFSTPMVQAIIRGDKTQTRRVCKHQFWQHSELVDMNTNKITQKVDRNVSCPFGEIGTVLWCRETWFKDHKDGYLYRADGHTFDSFGSEVRWKPSIHQPKEACRLFLRITDIRVERLNDISEEDAKAEGVQKLEFGYRHYQHDYAKGPLEIEPKNSFQSLWESINGKGSWDVNPWCWVLNFERIDKPENF